MSKAILLVNLGSPDSPSVPDVRRYLNEFLMDGRVIDSPWLVRRFVVGMILMKRPAETGHAYEKIWTKEGSPLVVISRHVQELLQKRLRVPVELAMRYQNPSIESAVKKLAAAGITETLLIPLFPHYAMSSYETAVVRVQEVAAQFAPQMKLTVQPPYYDQPDYITALAASAADYLKKDFDHLLFSFHGIPERHIKKSDVTGCHCLATPNCCETPSPAHAQCYRAQCYRTAALFIEKTGVPAGKWSVSFQSRLGKDPWLKPYTDYELPRLATEEQETDARDLPRVRFRLPGTTIEEIGMRAAARKFIVTRQRPGIHPHPLHERTSRLDHRPRKHGQQIPGG